jgi:hypothetical protein
VPGEKPAHRRAGKRTPTRLGDAVPEPIPAASERRFVDIDPWAVHFESLWIPEKQPVVRKGRKGE